MRPRCAETSPSPFGSRISTSLWPTRSVVRLAAQHGRVSSRRGSAPRSASQHRATAARSTTAMQIRSTSVSSAPVLAGEECRLDEPGPEEGPRAIEHLRHGVLLHLQRLVDLEGVEILRLG